MSRTKEKPVCESGPRWLKEVATTFPSRIGLEQPVKSPLAPLTGQDYQAYRTFLHALELYGYCDDEGRRHALMCMQHAVQAMQPHTRWVCRASIPHLLDWDDQQTLWPLIATEVAVSA
jgi:hypothetical protein